MADIFISYANADRAQVRLLASFLEGEGWSVWWDNKLAPGELYRDEIMQQLAAARAVVVLWTPNSVKSDFVRAEAGRAKADGKLIPLKVPGVGYADIPLPFGEMLTEDLTKQELVRAAVVAQLAKPALPPNALHAARAMLRQQVLTWLGLLIGMNALSHRMPDLRERLAPPKSSKPVSSAAWHRLQSASTAHDRQSRRAVAQPVRQA